VNQPVCSAPSLFSSSLENNSGLRAKSGFFYSLNEPVENLLHIVRAAA
jgi:hypothetical protein